ncbi:unnamed protein product, partial [Iphiclides podalirius]
MSVSRFSRPAGRLNRRDQEMWGTAFHSSDNARAQRLSIRRRRRRRKRGKCQRSKERRARPVTISGRKDNAAARRYRARCRDVIVIAARANKENARALIARTLLPLFERRTV